MKTIPKKPKTERELLYEAGFNESPFTGDTLKELIAGNIENFDVDDYLKSYCWTTSNCDLYITLSKNVLLPKYDDPKKIKKYSLFIRRVDKKE